MERLKKTILKNITGQIKKTAQAASGTTSYWGIYQPQEPKEVKGLKNNHRCMKYE